MTNSAAYQAEYRKAYRERAKRVNLTFDMAEYRSIARAANADGLPVAAYVKRAALAGHGQAEAARVPEELAGQLADLDRVIRSIANNVNQMARHSHRIGHVLDEQEVFLHIAELQRRLAEAVARASGGPGGTDGAGT